MDQSQRELLSIRSLLGAADVFFNLQEELTPYYKYDSNGFGYGDEVGNVLGDAANLPTSKAGSVVHFSAEVLYENLLCKIEGRPFTAKFDGHSNCYIETGHGKGALIDFNYDTEPLPGFFPFPGIGPFGLLKETRMNHYGKLLFRWIYWHVLLKGKEMPISAHMTMAGKKTHDI